MALSCIVEVEVCLLATSTARPSEIRERLAAALGRACTGSSSELRAGPVAAAVLQSEEVLRRNVRHARVCDIVAPEGSGSRTVLLPSLPFSSADLRV